ncbi:MAG: zinc-ribbon and DUF3426 domain-containing protein [Gammaproteobacteria bacterium]|nr:zinc-ribbon and DUF3426 domain-containing protein [Gammaproteobacteria bacterium]
MLFTRCPDCKTTFRITADALSKAGGQVRCGRCACVFDAYAELRERQSDSSAETGTHPVAVLAPPGADARAEPAAPAPPAAGPRAAAPDDEAFDGLTVADVIAGIESGVENGDDSGVEKSTDSGDEAAARAAKAKDGTAAEAAAAEANTAGATAAEAKTSEATAAEAKTVRGTAIGTTSLGEKASGARTVGGTAIEGTTVGGTAIESAAVGASSKKHEDLAVETRVAAAPAAPAPDAAASPPDWRLLSRPARSSRAARMWLAASVVAAIALGLQVMHYFRAEIAGAAVVGPLLQDAYALIGAEVTPNWDVGQYRIVDWETTAEPRADGQGSLKISVRIQNRGPKPQPYPHVHVQLMDRWDSAVGSRFFAPDQYLQSGARTNRPMAAGATARAALDVVDPGPDAYGFQLDLCVESGAQRLRCAADTVFR